MTKGVKTQASARMTLTLAQTGLPSQSGGSMLKVSSVASTNPQFEASIHFRNSAATTGVTICGRKSRTEKTLALP